MKILVALVFLTNLNNLEVLNIYNSVEECERQINSAKNLYCIPTTFEDHVSSKEQIKIFYEFLLSDKEQIKKYLN
jgi:hypothetical protein